VRILVGKDYYDSALSYGRDTALTFVREKDRMILTTDFINVDFRARFPVYERDKKDGSTYQLDLTRTNLFTLYAVSVVLCGVYYRGIELVYPYDSRTGVSPPNTFHWNAESLEIALNQIGCTLVKKDEKLPRYVRSSRYRKGHDRWAETQKKHSVETYFTAHEFSAEQVKYLVENRVVIAIYHERESRRNWQAPVYWTINSDGLKSVEFYRRVPPPQAFQEISMWVGGVMPQSSVPTVEISDKVRAEKHGMDKWSFRRPPKKDTIH